MYQLAICDDEPETRYYIGRTLIGAFREQGVPVSLEHYSDGNRFLDSFEAHQHFDVIFMDIEMPGINGLEVCRRIRKASADCIIVFISNKDELVFQSFEVQPFRFVRKTELGAVCTRLVCDIRKELLKKSRRILRITESGSGFIYSFAVNEILYVEAQRKQTRVVTRHDGIAMTVKLTDVEEQLRPFAFLKPHRSYLVNCSYVSIIQKDVIVLKDGTHIPLSRNRIDQVRTEFIRYANEGGI